MTGGGRGLGLTVLYALLESGSSVAAVDVLPEPAQPAWGQALSLARSKSLDLTYHSLDVTNAQSTAGVFTDIFASAPENRPVRGLFCSAGITLLVPAVEQTPEQFRTVLDVNLTGSFFCAQAFAREYTVRNPPPAEAPGADEVESGKLKEDTSWKGRGASIVLTGSMSATVANVGLDCISYNASKAGVVQMGRNMAMEWGRKGIRVNVGSPAHSFDFRWGIAADYGQSLSPGYVSGLHQAERDSDGWLVDTDGIDGGLTSARSESGKNLAAWESDGSDLYARRVQR